jgi:hypothetical protein
VGDSFLGVRVFVTKRTARGSWSTTDCSGCGSQTGILEGHGSRQRTGRCTDLAGRSVEGGEGEEEVQQVYQ